MSSKLSYKFKMVLLGESDSGKTGHFNHIFHGTLKQKTRDQNTPNSGTDPGFTKGGGIVVNMIIVCGAHDLACEACQI